MEDVTLSGGKYYCTYIHFVHICSEYRHIIFYMVYNLANVLINASGELLCLPTFQIALLNMLYLFNCLKNTHNLNCDAVAIVIPKKLKTL